MLTLNEWRFWPLKAFDQQFRSSENVTNIMFCGYVSDKKEIALLAALFLETAVAATKCFQCFIPVVGVFSFLPHTFTLAHRSNLLHPSSSADTPAMSAAFSLSFQLNRHNGATEQHSSYRNMPQKACQAWHKSMLDNTVFLCYASALRQEQNARCGFVQAGVSNSDHTFWVTSKRLS